MTLFAPPPSNALLAQLSKDDDASVHAKATYLLGVYTSDATNKRLVELLDDRDPTVRRRAARR